MAASVADPGSFGHREMTALLNWQKFHYDKTGVFLRQPVTLLKLAFRVGWAFQPDKMAARNDRLT
jgi:hypothetical protein